MARNTRVLRCSPDDVFRVFRDAWLYPSWVVGASRMRDVDDAWPAAGSRLHHSFGIWPILIDDVTEVVEWSPPHRFSMRAKGWPIGEAGIVIDVKPRGDGCVVRIQEQAISGPALWVPRVIFDPLMRWRNAETLHRLAYLAEGMAARPSGPSTVEQEGE